MIGVEKPINGQSGQKPVHASVRRNFKVIKPGMNPTVKVPLTPIGIYVGRPCNGEGVHPVLVFQLMRLKKAVFATRPRYQTVIAASTARQASHTPSASKAMVSFKLSEVCLYSTVEFGR